MRDVEVIIHTPAGDTFPATIGREVTVQQLLKNLAETASLDKNVRWVVTDRRTGRVLDLQQNFESYPARGPVELDVAPPYVPPPRPPEPAPPPQPVPSRTPNLIWYVVGFVVVALFFLYVIGRD